MIGVHAVDEDSLVDGLGLVHARENGQPFARFLVALDRRRVRSYYVRRGFFAATVETEVQRVGQRADVIFTVVEGKRAKLARIELLELPADPRIDPAALRDAIPMEDGDAFDYESWDLAKPELTEALQELGYAWAEVDGVVLADAERAEAVILVTVDAGPLTTFGKVAVTGVPAGLEGAVDARVEVRSGERFSHRAIERTRTALYETGRFSLVRVEPDRKVRGKDVVDVAIHVSEAPRHELRLGGGVGLEPTLAELRLRGQYGIAGWPTPLTSTRLELRPALSVLRDDPDNFLSIGYDDLAPRLDATATLDRMDLVKPRYAGTVEGSFTYVAIEAYTTYGPRIRMSLRSPTYAGIVQASLGWQLGLNLYRDIDKVIQDEAGLEKRLRIDETERLGAYDQSVVIDLRDNKVAPRSGGYFELRIEEGTGAAGGERSYLRMAPEARGYLGRGSVVGAARVRVGALWGEVPATRRFFGGGANSQRGFPERQLAPFAVGVDENGDLRRVPYGGTGLIEVGGELRFPLPLPKLWRIDFRPLSGVAFLDGADVTEKWDDLDVGRLHWAAGGGVRLPTPVGPLRFDVGYRLNRTGASDPRPGSSTSFHLSVGEAF